MPTPLFNLRLSPKVQDGLKALAKVYGAPNTTSFVREVLEVMVSNDIEQLKAFVGRLIQKQGEQLTLQLNAVVDATPKPKAKGKGKAKR
jgi:predicted DNA-binding protein